MVTDNTDNELHDVEICGCAICHKAVAAQSELSHDQRCNCCKCDHIWNDWEKKIRKVLDTTKIKKIG